MGSNNSAKLDDPVATALGSDTDSSRPGIRERQNSRVGQRRLNSVGVQAPAPSHHVD